MAWPSTPVQMQDCQRNWENLLQVIAAMQKRLDDLEARVTALETP